jgi:phage baseplate assembly protein gpV
VRLDALDLELWAPVVVPAAGPGSGTVFLPRVGETVAVAFAGGDPGQPLVLGALWAGVRGRPETPDGSYAIVTPGGSRVVVADESVVVERDGVRVELDDAGIRIRSAVTVEVEASTVTVTAGVVRVDSGMVRVSGVLQADTVITNTVVASTYTPGVGNIS